MVTKKITLSLVNLNKQIFSKSVLNIRVSSVKGEMGIYPGHAPLITFIRYGPLCVFEETIENFFFIHSGIIEIQPEIVTILADTIIHSHELSESLVLKEKIKVETDKHHINSSEFLEKMSVIKAKLRVINLAKSCLSPR